MHPVCPFHAPSATSLRGRTPQDRQASSSISSVRQASFRLWYLWTTWRKLGSLTTGRPLDCLSRRGIKHSALAADDNPSKCPLIVEANRQTDAHIQCILAFANRLLPTYIADARAEKTWECTSFYFRFIRCSRLSEICGSPVVCWAHFGNYLRQLGKSIHFRKGNLMVNLSRIKVRRLCRKPLHRWLVHASRSCGRDDWPKLIEIPVEMASTLTRWLGLLPRDAMPLYCKRRDLDISTITYTVNIYSKLL